MCKSCTGQILEGTGHFVATADQCGQNPVVVFRKTVIQIEELFTVASTDSMWIPQMLLSLFVTPQLSLQANFQLFLQFNCVFKSTPMCSSSLYHEDPSSTTIVPFCYSSSDPICHTSAIALCHSST